MNLTEHIEEWRRDPVAFLRLLTNPETGQPFTLLPAQEAFLRELFAPGPDGRLRYSQAVFSAPKKSGKSTFGALVTLYVVLVWGGRHAEAVILANDLEQAESRVAEAARRIVEATPWLARLARITRGRIDFPGTGSYIQAIAAQYESAAGANPVVVVFDELWAYTTERSRRLWDELVPVPTRAVSLRLVTSYAGYSGEPGPLRELYDRGVEHGERVSQVWPLYRDGDLLVFWSHKPIAPWQTPEWIESMRRTLRPAAFARQIENRWAQAEEGFIPIAWWDRAATAAPIYAKHDLPVVLGVDAALRRDTAAVVAVTWDKQANALRIVNHKIFKPGLLGGRTLDLENTLEAAVKDFAGRFRVVEVRYDPYQFVRSAQTLAREGIKMVEYGQTPPNLAAMSSNLYELFKSGAVVAYPDPDFRSAFAHAVAVETPRGIRIAKEKRSHKIDLAVALAMAAVGGVKQGLEPKEAWGGYIELPPSWQGLGWDFPTEHWQNLVEQGALEGVLKDMRGVSRPIGSGGWWSRYGF